MMLWFTRNKNGEIPVRKIADKVINSYRDLIYSHKQIDEERAELNYAEKRALQEIPHIREKINKTETERERAIRLIDELREKYNTGVSHGTCFNCVSIPPIPLMRVSLSLLYFSLNSSISRIARSRSVSVLFIFSLI